MKTLPEKPRILVVGDVREDAEEALAAASQSHEVVVVEDPLRALALLRGERYDGVLVAARYFQEAFETGNLLRKEQVLEGLPYGVALLESDNSIRWDNGRIREWSGRDSVVGMSFYAALGSPEILGPDFCPFHTAWATDQGSSSTLRNRRQSLFRGARGPGPASRTARRSI